MIGRCASMRVLVVTEHFWPEEFRINDVAVALAGRGHDVEVLTAMPNYPSGRYASGYSLLGPYGERHEGVSVRRVPVVPRGGGQAWRLALNYASYLVEAAAALALGRAPWDVALVFQPTPVTTIAPALVARARGVPVVTWIQDLWPETLRSTGIVRSEAALRGAGALSRALYRRCDLLLVQSDGYLPVLRGLGIPPHRLGVLPNWAEGIFEAPLPAAAALPSGSAFSVVFAGNLGRVQALDTVISAAERLRERECHWVFAGDGTMRPWVEEQVERRGLAGRVHLLGRRPVSEMPALFAAAGAMLVSLGRDDVLARTIPSKLQTYLAAGRPVLGSLDGEGARVIEAAGAGWASAAEDAGGLARNVERMMASSEDTRREMGRAARRHYDLHFSRAACLDRLEDFLAAVSRRGASRAAAPEGVA